MAIEGEKQKPPLSYQLSAASTLTKGYLLIMNSIDQQPPKGNPFRLSFLFPQDPEVRRRFLAYFCVVLGMLSRWLWVIGWVYVHDPTIGLQIGPPQAVIVRILLSFIAASMTFVATYDMINKMARDKWKVYFYAFACGFLWMFNFQATQ